MVLGVKRAILSVRKLQHDGAQLFFGPNDLENYLILEQGRVRMQRDNNLYFIKARVVNGDAHADVQPA
eukprot:6970443-Alexandrium_andersonii.AAC.1